MLSRTILIAGALQALFLLLLLLGKKPKNKADRYLTGWILLIGLNLLFFYDATATAPAAPIQLQLLGFFLPLLHAPVLLAYLHQLTERRPIHWWELGLHSLPYLLGISILFYYHLLPETTLLFKQGFVSLDGPDPLGWGSYLGIPIAVSACSYAVAGLVQLRKFRRRLPDLHANPTLVNLAWFRYLTVAAIVFFCLVFLVIQFGPALQLIGNGQVFVLVGGLTTVYVFCFGYFGLRQRALLPAAEPAAPPGTREPKASYLNSGLTTDTAKSLFATLTEHLKTSEAYLDETLNLPDLANQLGCPPNQLSQVINQEGNTNFFGFINAYRLAAIKEKLRDPAYDHYTILALALDCGFGSKASFNKIFKETTGTTPSAFRKNR